MANWYGDSRSNYFKVKDLDAFKAALDDTGISIWVKPSGVNPVEGTVGIYIDHGEGWPNPVLIEREDEDGLTVEVEVDLVEFLAPHLEDGWVCVLMEVGAEKLRYVTGYAQAFNNKGEFVDLSLGEIYKRAEHLGEHITDASY